MMLLVSAHSHEVVMYQVPMTKCSFENYWVRGEIPESAVFKHLNRTTPILPALFRHTFHDRLSRA